jgi:PAT family beta-lactamase induction signal transducer AmpG
LARPTRTLAVLSALYFTQGLPFGFQALALPVYLRESGVALATIGFLSALSLPWMIKPVWGPLVDRYGTRRRWIVPLQAGLALTCAAAALAPPTSRPGMTALLGLVFLMNVFASTQDVAVDGLAVDLLRPEDLGVGNTAQVVGYKVGMLTGGGVLVGLSPDLGWRGLFLVMAGLVTLALLVTLTVREAPRRPAERESFRDIYRTLATALWRRETAVLVVFLATYKLGESMNDTMWKPFLVDAGLGARFIGWVNGTLGMAASIAGSVAGGWLATVMPLERALWIPATARLGPLGAQAVVAAVAAGKTAVAAVVVAEHFCGGALTTVVFATMMARTDKRVGATHFTALAAVEVFGKFPGAWISGPVAQAFGYPAVFALGTALSAAFLLVLARLTARR